MGTVAMIAGVGMLVTRFCCRSQRVRAWKRFRMTTCSAFKNAAKLKY
jgi:hypothetical protein